MSTFQAPPDAVFGQQPETPKRSSVAGVISLVLGILSIVGCCIPGVGPVIGGVGAVLAVLALVFIGRSGGRLGGRGAAIGGLVCSIIGVFFGLLLLVGASQFMGMFVRYGRAVEIAHSDDTTPLQEMLTTSAVQAATPESFAAFKNETIASLGKFQEIKPGWGRFFQAFSQFGALQGSLPPAYAGGGGTVAPIPMLGTFEKGDALIIFVVDQNEKSGTMQIGKLENVGVAPVGGPISWLIDPAGK